MKIGITLSSNAYTPEAYAYAKFLENKGHIIQLDIQDNLYLDNDINIYFLGIKPPIINKKNLAVEIHEYQSLSTPPFAHLKNVLKRMVNTTPAGRIFLNSKVKDDFHFNDKIPFIYRDMGIDNSFFSSQVQNTSNKYDYDIVYSGSINNRPGLLDVINQLTKKYRLLLIGSMSNEYYQLLRKNKNITCTGRMKYQDLPALYAQAKFGLNYTPNIYPFNIQTSTKTLEYLASGLHLISNRYEWVNNFCFKQNYTPIWLDELYKIEDINNIIHNKLPNMDEYCWDSILHQVKFAEFIYSLYQNTEQFNVNN